MPSMQMILACVIAIAAAFGAGFMAGWTERAVRADLAQSKSVIVTHEQSKQELVKANDAAQSLEQKDAEAKIVYRAVTQMVDRIVEKPVYREQCLDADGLRAANLAIAGALADPAEPDAALREPATAF